MAIGQRLRERRKSLRLTQRELAAYAELSHNTIYKIERGQANPTLGVLLKLADVLGLELSLQAKQLPR